jgi:hypothetical protein
MGRTMRRGRKRFSGAQRGRSAVVLKLAGEKVLFNEVKTSLLTSSVTGPDDGVAPPNALWGKSNAAFAQFEFGCPARCTRR